MRRSTPTRLVQGFLLFRLGAGLAFLLAPGPATRPWLGAEPGVPLPAVRLAVGGRDVLLSLAGLYAVDSGGDPRPWLRLAAAAEAADAALTLAAPARLPRAARLRSMAGAGALSLTAWVLAGRSR